MNTALNAASVYLELCETAFCFIVAILIATVKQTIRLVEFIMAWKEWRWEYNFLGVSVGFDLQQRYDDLETVWITYVSDSTLRSIYWCRENGLVKVAI